MTARDRTGNLNDAIECAVTRLAVQPSSPSNPHYILTLADGNAGESSERIA